MAVACDSEHSAWRGTGLREASYSGSLSEAGWHRNLHGTRASPSSPRSRARRCSRMP
jgi:hypothetical protein